MGQRDQRNEVDAFVRRHFTWPGTLRLHGAAFGLDILRAPVNVLLSLIVVLARIAAWICRLMRVESCANWLLDRRFLLRTAVSARVEAAILNELLDVPLSAYNGLPDRAAMSRAILSAPRLREMIRRCGTVAEAHVIVDRVICTVGDYTGTRSLIAEFTTALLTLAAGVVVFQAITPGLISMAPGVAQVMSQSNAIAAFPLGAPLGGVWYSVFPVGPSFGLVTGTVAVLMIVGSVVAAFAGVIADPIQVRLGIHRRRLMRLFDTLDAEIAGSRDKPFAAQEHFLARIFDLWDAALSLFRIFRG